MDLLKKQAINLLKELITIPSVSRNEVQKADFLSHFLERNGCIVARHKNNLWCVAGKLNDSKPTIMLNSHMDTVQPSSSWSIDPFKPIEKDGKIYGLGANDAHASLVSLIATFLFLKDTPQLYNLVLAISAEEEVSGINGMESLVKVLPKIDFAIVGEPTQMQLAIAEKGLMVVDCVAHGKSGHAAREEGVNAIYKAVEDIKWFQTYSFPEVSDLLGKVKMSVTLISAGIQHNVVPDKCSFSVDIRVNECYTNKEVFEVIQSNVQSDVVARSFRLNSSSVDKNHAFVKKCLSMNLPVFGSSTLSDQTFMSFPSVKIGVGDSARSHTADEYIYISEISDAIEMYISLLSGLRI